MITRHQKNKKGRLKLDKKRYLCSFNDKTNANLIIGTGNFGLIYEGTMHSSKEEGPQLQRVALKLLKKKENKIDFYKGSYLNYVD